MDLIAAVEFTMSPRQGKRRWTRLAPLYRSIGDRWLPIRGEELRVLCPSQGLIYWWDSPREAEERRSVWVVTVEEAPEPKGLDELTVLEGWRIVQCERIPGLDSLGLRRRCAEGKLELKRQPFGPILAQLPGEASRWVGLLSFRPSAEGRHVGPTAVPTGFLDLHDITEGQVQRLALPDDGAERLVQVLRPGYRAEGMRIGYWAAQDDEHLLQGVLKRLQHLDADATEWLDFTDRAAHEYSKKLAKIDLIGDDARREAARTAAAIELLAEAKLSCAQLDMVAEMLVSRTEVKERVDEAVNRATEARLAELDTSFRSQEREREEALRVLESEIAKLQAEVAEKGETLLRMEEEAKKRFEAAARTVLAKPLEKVGESLFVEALIAASRDPSGARSFPLPAEGPPLGKPCRLSDELRGATKAVAMSTGLDDATCAAGTAAMLARRPLFVCGARSLDLCRALGSLASAGMVWEVYLSTTIFGLEDLLDLPAVALHQPNDVFPLGTLLTARARSEHFGTIIFRGVNRAPLEVAFTDLLMSAIGRPPGVPLPWSRGRSHASAVPPPTGCHLLATLSTGSSCFPIPVDLLDRVAIVDTDRWPAGTRVSSLGPPQLHATCSQWKTVAEETRAAGRDLSRLLRQADEDGFRDEYHLYSGVFGDGLRAAVEWILSRRSRHLVERLESDILDNFAPDVRFEVNAIVTKGGLIGISRHISQER